MRRLRWLLALALVAGGAESAMAAEVHVSAYDQGDFDLFSPSDVDLAQGDTVVFDFDGPSTHTATDDTGMDLYDSGIVAGGGPSFSYTYVAAGTYRFICFLHEGMGGVAHVPIVVRPSAAAPRTAVRVRWATDVADPGFVYDVQLRRPGGEWRSWQKGVTVRRATFEPGRTGTFRFRARLRKPGVAASGWSTPGLVTVG